MDVVINIGDFSVSLYEGEQEILGKLDKMGLLYEKVEDSDNKKYNYYYNVGDGEAQFIQVYFLEKECVRIRISSNETFAHTSRGIYSGNTYSQMVEQYGDSYEKHTYIGKERYTIYRYALGECFHVFGKAKDKDNRQTYASAMKYFVIFTLLAFLVKVVLLVPKSAWLLM